MIPTHPPAPRTTAWRWPAPAHWIALAGVLGLIQAPDAGAAADPTAPPAGWSAAPAPAAAPLLPATPSTVTPPAANGASLALVGRGRRVALVNGQSVRQGDTIEGYRVIEIGTRSIILQGHGHRRTLPLTPGIEIRPRPEHQP